MNQLHIFFSHFMSPLEYTINCICILTILSFEQGSRRINKQIKVNHEFFLIVRIVCVCTHAAGNSASYSYKMNDLFI